MNIIKNYITANNSFKNPKIKVTGLVLHSIGCAQSKAEILRNNENKAGQPAVHGFIDSDTGDVIMTLPTALTEADLSDSKTATRGAHAGVGKSGVSANSTHIGIEMCESCGIKYVSATAFQITNKELFESNRQTAYDSAVTLFAKLCRLYDLDPLANGVIISHYEGYKRGIASGHSDPEHYWMDWKTMDDFRHDVMEQLIADSAPLDTPEDDEHEPGKLMKYSGNIYAEPPRQVGTAPAGTYTIVEWRNVNGAWWGKLKSGAGWIPEEGG